MFASSFSRWREKVPEADEGGALAVFRSLKAELSCASARVTFRFSLSTNNQKEGHPMLASYGHPPPSRGQALCSGFAFGDGIFRWCIRAPAKNVAHPARRPPPSRGQALRVYPPPPAAPQGPRFRQRIHALSCVDIGHRVSARSALLQVHQIKSNPSPTLPCIRKGGRSEEQARKRMDALPLRGPCAAAGGGGQPEGRCARCASFFVSAWMHCRKIPSLHADPKDRMSGGRVAGVPFFLVPSFLGKPVLSGENIELTISAADL